MYSLESWNVNGRPRHGKLRNNRRLCKTRNKRDAFCARDCCGNKFNVDVAINSIKFVSSVYIILLKCGTVSEEVKWNMILTQLLHGLYRLHLNNMQVHKLFVAYSSAERCCLNVSRFTSARNILQVLGSMSIDFFQGKKKVLLMKQGF